MNLHTNGKQVARLIVSQRSQVITVMLCHIYYNRTIKKVVCNLLVVILLF